MISSSRMFNSICDWAGPWFSIVYQMVGWIRRSGLFAHGDVFARTCWDLVNCLGS